MLPRVGINVDRGCTTLFSFDNSISFKVYFAFLDKGDIQSVKENIKGNVCEMVAFDPSSGISWKCSLGMILTENEAALICTLSLEICRS